MDLGVAGTSMSPRDLTTSGGTGAVLEGTALGAGPVQDHNANVAATTRLTAKRIGFLRLYTTNAPRRFPAKA